jgi:hypothetical protein
MNADQTYNSVVFKKSYDDVSSSLRQSTARGINEPDQMVIRNQTYVDSKTKVSGQRFNVRVGRVDIDANLVPVETSFAVTIQIPSTAVQADVDVVLATFKAVVADASFLTNVMNSEK